MECVDIITMKKQHYFFSAPFLKVRFYQADGLSMKGGKINNRNRKRSTDRTVSSATKQTNALKNPKNKIKKQKLATLTEKNERLRLDITTSQVTDKEVKDINKKVNL